MKTELNDRTLWFDGDITVDPDVLLDYVEVVDNVHVTEMTPDIVQYNSLCTGSDRVTVKESLNPFDHSWKLPDEYKKLNLVKYIVAKLEQLDAIEQYTDEEFDVRLERAMLELKQYQKLGLTNLVRTLIYIVDVFERDNVVWGPGRGSSVSSYVLYLIGIHDVDSVLFELDLQDFMKDVQS